MTTQIRATIDGSLRAVQASGSGRAWATAAAPISGLFGFIESFSFTSAATITTMMERGVPDHHKTTEKAPIDVTLDFKWVGTAFGFATASGASMPLHHLEVRYSALETPGTGYYYQFHGCAIQSTKFNEAKDGNKVSLTIRALAMVGPTASGFLS